MHSPSNRLKVRPTDAALVPRLARALFGVAGLRLIGMALSFLVGVQLARGLGAAGYGIYGVAMSAIALLIIPAEFGMPQLLVREIAASEVVGNWGRMRGVVRWANHAAWLLSLAVATGLALWILLTDPGLQMSISKTLICGVFLVPAVTLGRQRGAALLGLHHIIKGQVPDAIIRPSAFSLMLLAAHLLLGKITPVLAMALGALSAALALAVVHEMFRRRWPLTARVAPVETDSRRWWASAVPMALTEGMRGLQGNVATLVMGALATAAATGVFRVASSISVVVGIPVSLFILVGSPTISKLHAEGNREGLQQLIGWLSVGMTAGSILLAVPFFAMGQPLLHYLFGAEFELSNAPLLVLCAGSIAYSIFGPAIILLNMTGHERRVTRSFFISLFFLLLLILPLVRLYGAMGAAVASALAMVLGNAMMWIDAKRYLSVDTSILYLLVQRKPKNA